MKYGPWTLGQTEALLNKLGGVENARRLLTCSHVRVSFPEGGEALVAGGSRIPATITLGNGLTNMFWQALVDRGFRVPQYARELLCHTHFIPVLGKMTIPLVVRSVAELGFERAVEYSAICVRAYELGYELLPAEAGPQFRLQCGSLPVGEFLIIAMEPLAVTPSQACLFCVENHEGREQLHLYDVGAGRVCHPAHRFVFSNRLKAAA